MDEFTQIFARLTSMSNKRLHYRISNTLLELTTSITRTAAAVRKVHPDRAEERIQMTIKLQEHGTYKTLGGWEWGICRKIILCISCDS